VRAQRTKRVLTRGLALRLACDPGCEVRVLLRSAGAPRLPLGAARWRLSATAQTRRLRLHEAGRRILRRRGRMRVEIHIAVVRPAGGPAVVQRMRIGPARP
jgi:hypothetical protein